MVKPEHILSGVENVSANSCDIDVGMLKVLGSKGAIDAFAQIQANYPELLMTVLAFEQMEALKKGGMSSDAFTMFVAGQVSLAKYFTQSLKFIKHVDNTGKVNENL